MIWAIILAVDNLTKIVWKNIPVSVPEEWCEFFNSRSRQLGISRNAAIGLALKLGAPLLDAHVLLMGSLIKDNCRKITEQGGELSEILEPPADLFSMIDGNGDRRKRQTNGREILAKPTNGEAERHCTGKEN